MNMLDGMAVQQVAELATKAAGNQPPIIIEGDEYATAANLLQRVKKPIATPEPLRLTTLAALVAFVQQNDLGDVPDGPTPIQFLHVVSPTEVRLVSELLGPEMQRHTYAIAAPILPDGLEKSYAPETFVIALQSRCEEGEDRDRLIALASNVRAGAEVGLADDGVSQTLTGKAGLTLVNRSDIRNPVYLAPYRTFQEVEQPTSAYVVRAKMSQDRSDIAVTFTLHEADGGAWRLDAMSSIRKWLETQQLNVPVLA